MGAVEQKGLLACNLLDLLVADLNGMSAAERARAIDRAFKKRSVPHHPDKGGDPARFAELAAARDDLKEWMGCMPARSSEYSRSVSPSAAADLIEEMLNEDARAEDKDKDPGFEFVH